MAGKGIFDEPSQLERLLVFLTQYQWIWDIKITQLFLRKHFMKIPSEWIETLLQWKEEELRSLPEREIKILGPSSLHYYLTQCKILSMSTQVPEWVELNEVKVKKDLARGMSPKKHHEVSRLAGVVKQVCQETQCDCVLDIGSGLGYLGNCLSSQCGLSVICVERDAQRVDAANVRESKLVGSHGHHMTSVAISLNDSLESVSAITNLIDKVKKSSNTNVCLVGLHCCGDLTSTLLHLISSHPHPSLRSAVIVPCCYHKMSTSEEGRIRHFPLSRCVKQLMSSQRFTNLNHYAFRLAAQDSVMSWQSQTTIMHQQHTRYVAYRAILEILLQDKMLEQSLSGRSHRKVNYEDFEGYIDSLIEQLSLPEHFKDTAMKEYEKHTKYIPLIEPFTGLQVCIQQVIETLILYDEVIYLRENGLEAELVPVFDLHVSPRGVAIIAKRRKI